MMGMGWIKTKDQKPKFNEPVVGFHSAQLVPVVCFLTNTGWNIVTACFYTDPMGQLKTVSGTITHWMPIPEPPK